MKEQLSAFSTQHSAGDTYVSVPKEALQCETGTLTYVSPQLQAISEKVIAGERLSFDEGVTLMRSDDLLTLGRLADHARKRISGDRVFYSRVLYSNPTNVCITNCKFCAFYRPPKHAEGYVVGHDEIAERVKDPSLREVHIVGGHHPTLKLDYFERFLKTIRSVRPDLWIKAFTVVELDHFSKVNKMPVSEVILRLKEAGLDSVPGGGAEIFAERVRQIICPLKISGEKWLEIMELVNSLGVPSNATMLYGHIENAEERVDHILKIRGLQDKTGKVLSFIPLAFQPENHEMSHLPGTTGFDDLKVHAVSRILLDNVPHIKGLWTTMGIKTAQAALHFGVDDLGGTFLNEQVMDEAGAKTRDGVSAEMLERMIRDAGRTPVETNSSYLPLNEMDLVGVTRTGAVPWKVGDRSSWKIGDRSSWKIGDRSLRDQSPRQSPQAP